MYFGSISIQVKTLECKQIEMLECWQNYTFVRRVPNMPLSSKFKFSTDSCKCSSDDYNW